MFDVKDRYNDISLVNWPQSLSALASAPNSRDWLHALPISSCGLCLDGEALRIAVGLRLGSNLCDPHDCTCGSLVDCRGSYDLSY